MKATPEKDLERAEASVADAQASVERLQARRAHLVADLEQQEKALRGAAAKVAEEGGPAASEAYEDASRVAGQFRAALRAMDDELLPAARAQLQAASSAAAGLRRSAQYGAAAARAEATAKRFVAFYARWTADFRQMLEDLAEAATLVAAANADLPPGAMPLLDAEALVRDREAIPEQVLSEETVQLWTYVSTGQRVPEEHWSSIRKGNDDKFVIGSARRVLRPVEVERKPYLRREVLPLVRRAAGPRLSELALPGLSAADPAAWPGIDRDILPRVTAELQAAPPPAAKTIPRRSPRVHLEPLFERPARYGESHGEG